MHALREIGLEPAGALAGIYPVLARLVGEDYFNRLARRLIRTSGSGSSGRGMAGFLATLPEGAALPYLCDVAALEWAWHEAAHAPEAPALDRARLAELTPAVLAELRFRLHPAARLVASRYPVLAVWEANQEGAPPQLGIALDAGADWLLVARRGLARSIERLTPGEYALLAALAAQAPLEEACGAATAAAPGIDLEAAMARFIGAHVLTGFY